MVRELGDDIFDVSAPKVLVVDDHAVFRDLSRSLLEAEGYTVVEATNGFEALKLMKTEDPDVILTDVMMPEMSGFDLCRELKSSDVTRFIPVIILTAYDDRQAKLISVECGADEFLSKPLEAVELSVRVKVLVRQKRLNEDLDHAEKALFSIARAIESRDPNTGNHCERLVRSGQLFGRFLGLSRLQIRDLAWSGYLHDIGKVGVPDAILLKPGKLTDEEWVIMRSHVIIGEEICAPLRTMQGVIPIVRSHHERWDGSGYPDGLKGHDIPRLAQVFQLLDIWDALTSERPYKNPFPIPMALQMMDEEVQRGWRDPELMEKFRDFINSETVVSGRS